MCFSHIDSTIGPAGNRETPARSSVLLGSDTRMSTQKIWSLTCKPLSQYLKERDGLLLSILPSVSVQARSLMPVALIIMVDRRQNTHGRHLHSMQTCEAHADTRDIFYMHVLPQALAVSRLPFHDCF